jgi:adenylate kinase family enzyme
MSKTIDTKQIPSELALYMQDANRLIDVGNESVNSFFVFKDLYKDAHIDFTGFIQDSLVVKENGFRISTGGVSVAAELYQIESYLEFVDQNGITKVKSLRENRNASREYILEIADGSKFERSGSFVSFHPLAYSVSALLANGVGQFDGSQKRATLFNLINLHYFLSPDGWPQLKNVDKAHPFVAHKVQRAVMALERNPTLMQEIIKTASSKASVDPFKEAGLTMPNANLTEYAEKIREIRRSFKEIRSVDRLLSTINQSHTLYHEQAERYLWEQLGYAPQDGLVANSSLLYDPVGACFALNILLSSTESTPKGEPQKILGEHINLILRSLRHILESLTRAGTFPYGVPFSYKTDGTAGFATSADGLSALGRFLVQLLYRARKLDYPSQQFLEQLLIDNYQNFEKLFELMSSFASGRRFATLPAGEYLKKGVKLFGWSTDRAPNNSRIESWVTIEVLLFAIYIREALQEYAQFFVGQKYSARTPKGEPVWPYKGETAEKIDQRKLNELGYSTNAPIFIDPDELDNERQANRGSRNNRSDCPIQFLHENFKEFIFTESKEVGSWKQNVSSVLLFGPPGTAKSTTATSLAQALGWHFIELSPSNFIIEGLESIEQKAKEIFDELSVLRETVILFDELDSLFVDRELLSPESIINFLVPAMLPKLQRLSKRAKKQRLIIVIATNFYDRLDPAMVRKGRIDKHLLVLPYNDISRLDLLQTKIGAKSQFSRDKSLVEEFKKSTRLYVYEEVEAVSKAIEKESNSPSFTLTDFNYKYPASAINPAIYLSRIPREDKRASRIRSTQRLGLEVSEVVGRLLDEERSLSSDDDKASIQSRLSELAHMLGANEGLEEWKSLCDNVRHALDFETPENQESS